MSQNIYFLAIDIGASSGRAILGYIKDKKLQLEEIYRFKNDDSVKGYIGELIFYKIMTQKDDAGLPVFRELISTFFEKLPDRFFKYKKNSDLLTVD